MKTNKIALLLLIVCFFILCKGNALIRLPAVISNHMVLQQNGEVKIWGWCDPGEKIKINSGWDTITYSATGNPDGKWLASIKTSLAGGPYSLIINGSNKIVLDDILIGEVWLCSGQSNMEMNYNWGIKQYTQDANDANNKSIRFFHVPRLTANYPQDDTKGEWVVCNPEDMKNFSLAGYFFGQKIQQYLSVPVGLIEASWGGTPAEVWTPKEAIENNLILRNVADSLQIIPWGPIRIAAAYNAMVYPLTNFKIAGVIWYQGEANVDNASTYNSLFATMITAWRKAWSNDFPFYFVQIAPFAGYGNNISGPLLKEAQTNTLTLPGTGMVVIDDYVTDVNDIHPKDKKDAGYRLAYLALSDWYGKKNLVYRYPMYKSMEIKNDKVKINFSDAPAGLINKGDTVKGFYIAGADKNFMPATAKISGSTVTVYNAKIKNPVAVRLNFTNASIPTLFNKEGMPVNLFRTDDWNNVNTINGK